MKLSAKLPQDDQGAQLMRFKDIRGQRYTEIFLIGGHAITHQLVGGVYNTTGMNDPGGTGDTCPQDVLDKVDVDDLKEHYDVLSAFKNGPRLWCLDWAEVMVGAERDFDGLQARWVMWLGSSTGGSAGSPSAIAYSACMHSQGVPNYPDPDPDSSGQLPKGDAQQFGVSTSQYQVERCNTSNEVLH